MRESLVEVMEQVKEINEYILECMMEAHQEENPALLEFQTDGNNCVVGYLGEVVYSSVDVYLGPGSTPEGYMIERMYEIHQKADRAGTFIYAKTKAANE